MPNLDTRTTKTPAVDDYTYLLSNDGTVEGKVELQDITVIPETTRTINFTSSQTAAQIQADIDAVGKYLPDGVSITFQFGNGTYTLNNNLDFDSFYGGGVMYIQGDTSQTAGLHTDHNVHLNFNNNTHGIICRRNSATFQVRHLKITCDDSKTCVLLISCASVYTLYNYLLNNAKTSSGSKAISMTSASIGTAEQNYFSNNFYGINCTTASIISSNNNDDTGTQPNYGLRVDTAGIIGKANTQPTGSTANESLGQGGNIF